MNNPKLLFGACIVAGLCVLPLRAQDDTAAYLSHTFEPSKWTPEDRIRAVENGLLLKPIIVTGQPLERTDLVTLIKDRNVPGVSVAVVENSKIAWTKAYGVTDTRAQQPVTPDTLFNAGGITKVVTAVTTAVLCEKGKVSLDQDIRPLLKHWTLPQNQFVADHPITLRELLSHSSGFTGHFPTKYSPADKLPSLLQQLNGEPPSKAKAVEVGHQPGTSFEYSSAAFLVIQQVLSDLLDKPFPEIVQEEVFSRIGMTHSTFVQPASEDPDPLRATAHVHTKEGALKAQVVSFPELASSGLWTTPSDLARLLIELQNSGRKGALLSSKAYTEMLTPVTNNAGLGVFLAGSDADRYFRARGTDGLSSDGFAAWFTGYSHDRKGAVIMMNSNSLIVGFALLRSIAQQYGWSDYIPMRTLYPVQPDVLREYAGKYDVAGDVVSISADSSGLYAQLGGGRKYTLLPSSPTTFFINMDMFHEVQVCFVPHQGGAAEELVLQYPYNSYKGTRVH
jgi:CubicO group peptidase (beta-lactamase class C family)